MLAFALAIGLIDRTITVFGGKMGHREAFAAEYVEMAES
jgi:hypothetical protein